MLADSLLVRGSVDILCRQVKCTRSAACRVIQILIQCGIHRVTLVIRIKRTVLRSVNHEGYTLTGS